MSELIKVSKGLVHDPRVWLIADRLGISTHAVLGKLVHLWCWADTYANADFVPRYTGAMLDARLGQPGFTEQLAIAGWVEVTDAGMRFADIGG